MFTFCESTESKILVFTSNANFEAKGLKSWSPVLTPFKTVMPSFDLIDNNVSSPVLIPEISFNLIFSALV